MREQGVSGKGYAGGKNSYAGVSLQLFWHEIYVLFYVFEIIRVHDQNVL